MKFVIKKTSGKWTGRQKGEIVIDLNTFEELMDLIAHFGNHEIIIGKRFTYLNRDKIEVLGDNKEVKYFIEIYDGNRE